MGRRAWSFFSCGYVFQTTTALARRKKMATCAHQRASPSDDGWGAPSRLLARHDEQMYQLPNVLLSLSLVRFMAGEVLLGRRKRERERDVVEDRKLGRATQHNKRTKVGNKA